MKNLKTRLERLEQTRSQVADEPLVILYSVLSADDTKPKQLEPTALYAGPGGNGLVVERRPEESLDDLIVRAHREYPQETVWTGWYRPLEESSATETSSAEIGTAKQS